MQCVPSPAFTIKELQYLQCVPSPAFTIKELQYLQMCAFRNFDAVLCNFGTILFLFLCTLKTYNSAAFVSGVIPVSVKHNDPMWCGWGGINNKINVLTGCFIVRVTMA